MTEVLSMIIISVAICISMVAFFAVMKVLFPGRVEKTRVVAEEMPGRAFTIGLVNTIFFGAIALAFAALDSAVGSELPSTLAILVLILPGAGIVLGLVGVVQLVGERLSPQNTGFKRTVWGTLLLILACVLPIIGWFLLFPYIALLGLGAFIVGFFHRRRQPDVLTTEPPEHEK